MQRDLVASYNNLGDATVQKGQAKEALDFYRKAVAIAERLAAAHPKDAQGATRPGACYDGLGYVSFQSGRTQEALRFYQKAVTIAERFVAADPKDAQAQRA